MNRIQAIEAARNIRRGATVHTLVAERKPYIAAVAAVEEVKDEAGVITTAAVAAVEGQAASKRIYEAKSYTYVNAGQTLPCIGAAKRAMRALGRGVALVKGETLPQ